MTLASQSRLTGITAPRALAHMDFPTFVPRLPWRGSDLQTLRNYLLRQQVDLSAWPSERVYLDMADGSGDRLAALLQEPEVSRNRPLAILIHGLTGCEDSSYLQATARCLLIAGHPVVRLNLRGAGPSRAHCRGHYHAGRSEDLQAALTALGDQRPELQHNGVVMAGYSLGANTMIKFLATLNSDSPIRAAAAISTPLDLAASADRMAQTRNRIYHNYLLARMKEEAVAGAAEVSASERRAIESARRIYQFDDHFVAPRAGFANAADYYARCSAKDFLPQVECPTLVIHALDDPWIPAEAYVRFDWSCNPNLIPLLPQAGGHVGFHGQGGRTPWHDVCLLHFLGTLDV